MNVKKCEMYPAKGDGQTDDETDAIPAPAVRPRSTAIDRLTACPDRPSSDMSRVLLA